MLTPSPETHSVALNICGPGERLRRFGTTFQIATGFEVRFFKTAEDAARDSSIRSTLVLDAEFLLRSAMDEFARLTEERSLFSLALVAADGPSSLDLMRMLRAGVCGFVDWDCQPDHLRQVVSSVHAGALWISRRTICDFYDELWNSTDDDRFTRREIHILRRIAAGESNQKIADELCVTRDTVRWHLRSLYTKLGVHDRKQASALFHQIFKSS